MRKNASHDLEIMIAETDLPFGAEATDTRTRNDHADSTARGQGAKSMEKD
jgi:hypothetical protein